MNRITILKDGYSQIIENDPRGDVMKANCTCTLIQCETGENIIVDSLDAWSASTLLAALKEVNIEPDQINFCISTHCHPDHLGNNNLFLNARHIVGQTISQRDEYFMHDFSKEPFAVTSDVHVLATKGHTNTCVSVICKNSIFDGKTVAIVGDLFENEKDIDDPSIWREAGSESIEDQMKNRLIIATLSDYIVPGHGSMFKVTPEMRDKLENQLKTLDRNIIG
ncbi:metallo-beta-lactamase domain-containing protein 1 [Culicoides brevitarsis]|uniref:metallo-beta-lactamase domain-containing protein 1 n=1 Tax=Culicoides brevitarsis TaxID=469753 RepID=UPI00307BFF6E